MKDKALYLKEEAYFEPLFNHWYAWPYLLPPVTGARHIVNTHLRIMRSFVNNHELHVMAMKEPGLAGAEFVNCTEDQVDDIKRLINDLQIRCADLLRLSEAVSELDDLLRSHNSGQSIEYLYKKVPDELRGYVEIFMDLEHRPSYRLLEQLLYRSPFYKKSLQSVSFGLLSRVGDRPFVLSTPRLPDENHIQLDIDFASKTLDLIFESRERPVSASQLDEIFLSGSAKGTLPYQELFTETQSEYSYASVSSGTRLQYIGHAGFLFETPKISILIDPVIAYRGPNGANDITSYSQLPPKIDFVCLTHNHQDHISFETLLQLRYKVDTVLVPKNNGGSLVDPSIRLILKQLGFKVFELEDLEEIPIPDGRIISIPFLGEHGDLNVRSKTAWLIEAQGKKCFFGADSSNPDNFMYEHMKDILSDLDVFAIGMECVGAPYTWLYGALHTKIVSKSIRESRRLNGSDFDQAYPLIKLFNAKRVYIYALGREPWYKYFMGIDYDDQSRQILESNKLIAACEQLGVEAEAMFGKKTIILA